MPAAAAIAVVAAASAASVQTRTAVGASLLKARGPAFSDAWSEALEALSIEHMQARISAADTGAEGADSMLQSRIKTLRDISSHRRVLHDCLELAVTRCFDIAELQLLPDSSSLQPNCEPFVGGATLDLVMAQLPPEGANELQAFVKSSVPAADAEAFGQFDREQAAKLYMGHVQFGYFLSTVFRGAVQVRNEADVELLQLAIKQATTRMRSEAAWVVSSERAGRLFALEQGEGADDGFEQLRDFTAGVMVVSPSHVSEFFRGEAEGGSENVQNEQAVAQLPVASFVRFNSAALQGLLAEACFFGWHLWAAESEACGVLGEAADMLLDPVKVAPETTSNSP